MIQYGDVFGAPLLLDHGTSEITHDLITKLFELPKRRELGDDCVLLRLPILEIKQFQVGVQGIVMVFSCWCVYTETESSTTTH